jgi:hypothetical protein
MIAKQDASPFSGDVFQAMAWQGKPGQFIML